MEKMKYQDKVRFAETAIELLKQGESRESIENHLKEEGLKSWDIDKVNQSIDTYLNREYKSKIKQYMLDNVLESKLSEFDAVDAGFFEKIQHEIIAEVKLESREKVKSLISRGKKEDHILKTVVNPLFKEEEVYEAIDLAGQKTKEKKSQVNKGIGAILLGIVLTIFSTDIFPGGGVFFYGLILYGIISLVRSRQN